MGLGYLPKITVKCDTLTLLQKIFQRKAPIFDDLDRFFPMTAEPDITSLSNTRF
jgi:hypothetical protein